MTATVYATAQDLLERDPSFVWTVAAQKDNPDALDEVAMAAALRDATEEINSFLSRFTLPLATTPNTLNRLAISLAFYWLADRDSSVTDLVQKRYDDAISTLKDIQAGRRDLGLPKADKPAETQSGKAEVIAASRLAMRKDLGGVL
ncbi:gp436 family protein [Enterovibrio norvegicus]|uniref:DUF1320 domain-containing protein n=1 Tax=Enterovibrio norvegicus TaxID=188144 RepID=A0A2N7LA31_9GAMM|nr:DUF1320 domain-containing protein [Enterovibrio norvegicus]PMN91372.1 hypothetical protein BCT23_17855 [Enterovibrio norvegicus]